MLKIIIIVIIILFILSLISTIFSAILNFLTDISEYMPIILMSIASAIFIILLSVKGHFFTAIIIDLAAWATYLIINQALKIKKELDENRARRKKLELELNDINSNKKWLKEHSKAFLNQEVSNVFNNLINVIAENDLSNNIFTKENMSYGRANAFLNFNNTNIYSEEPLYFSCNASLEISDFREYGILITNRGIYTAYQCEYSKEARKRTKEKYYVISSCLPFNGLKSMTKPYRESGDTLVNISCTIINNQYKTESCCLKLHYTIAESVLALCNQVIKSGISAAMYNNTIYNDNKSLEAAQLYQKNLERQINTESIKNNIQTAAINANNIELNKAFNEVKNYMNGSRGGGYAAEYANNTSDRLLGKNVESTAQVLDSHGRQVKNGADRTVNGLEIQTKYYKTAQQSIGAAFENKHARYIRSDGTEKMMPIEVPRDQYDEALKLMQKRIDDGQVSGIEPGENATSYVKKGIYTYTQANNTAISGTIESLAIDSASGAVYTTNAAGISALITFATQIWHGKSVTDAVQSSLAVGTRVLGTGTVIYIATMQLTRNKIANPLLKDTLVDGTLKSVGSISNPITSISENIVTQIQRSAIAKSQLGNIFGLSRLTSQQFIAGTLAGVITFGPDLIKALNGKISGSQLFKNSTIAAAGIVGAGIGNTIAPVIGGIIGGAVAGCIAKKITDTFVEDDAINMFQILKEEFIEQVSLANLTNDELDRVVSITVGNQNLSTMLENMHASENYRYYASEKILRPAIKSVLSKRKKITQKAYIEALTNVLLPEHI